MYQTVILPYDTEKITLDIPSEHIAGILTPPGSASTVEKSEQEIILNALHHPIGTPRLSTLAEGKKNIVIITSDHTRPVPSKKTLPHLLEEIRLGSPEAKITILVATGLHRGMTEAEKVEKFGTQISKNERLVNHDAFDENSFYNLGQLPSGSKCEINKIAIDADLLVAEGFIEPHFFAGFSGGRKSVLPGIASRVCVNINHSSKAIQHPLSATGVLDGNPIHEDMFVAAKLANLAFIFNVLLDDEKRITAAYSGDYDLAHQAGCAKLLEQSGVDAIPAKIVITTNGGYPLDQNLYQCPKGLDAALACVKKDGVIILAAACRDGLGGENFGRMMQEGSPQVLLKRILETPPEETISEQWCVQRFAEALQKYHIILVTRGIDRKIVESMNFIYAETIEDALHEARKITGEAAKITVIPDGVSVIIRRNENE